MEPIQKLVHPPRIIMQVEPTLIANAANRAANI